MESMFEEEFVEFFVNFAEGYQKFKNEKAEHGILLAALKKETGELDIFHEKYPSTESIGLGIMKNSIETFFEYVGHESNPFGPGNGDILKLLKFLSKEFSNLPHFCAQWGPRYNGGKLDKLFSFLLKVFYAAVDCEISLSEKLSDKDSANERSAYFRDKKNRVKLQVSLIRDPEDRFDYNPDHGFIK